MDTEQSHGILCVKSHVLQANDVLFSYNDETCPAPTVPPVRYKGWGAHRRKPSDAFAELQGFQRFLLEAGSMKK